MFWFFQKYLSNNLTEMCQKKLPPYKIYASFSNGQGFAQLCSPLLFFRLANLKYCCDNSRVSYMVVLAKLYSLWVEILRDDLSQAWFWVGIGQTKDWVSFLLGGFGYLLYHKLRKIMYPQWVLFCWLLILNWL